jgi:ketosteroid isomerase-like protein
MLPGVPVTETFEQLFKAILEDRDVDAFMDCWAGDDDITMWGSDLHERAVGRDAIRALGTQIAGSQHVLRFEWEELRAHDEGDTGWLNASGSLTVDDGERRDYRLTAVFVRRDGRWRWHTFSGSIPD